MSETHSVLSVSPWWKFFYSSPIHMPQLAMQ
jgi:hypothetical protein